jgi:hypothetical protein
VSQECFPVLQMRSAAFLYTILNILKAFVTLLFKFALLFYQNAKLFC